MRKLTLLLLGIFSISLVLALHLARTPTDTTTFLIKEDFSYIFNITINVTDTIRSANISQVNITIPSIFTFIANSNGTDGVTTTTFTNTSTVLSWSNDSLVMNLSWRYFWFNASASTPGFYNFTITTKNATGAYYTNISIVINDTTAPVVTLISPDNATSATTAAYNFTFNVTDDSTISSCILFLNDSAIQTLTSISNTGATTGMYNSSLAIATYNWSVNCTDNAGNNGVSTMRILTVTSPPVTQTDLTSGTTSTPTGPQTYTIPATEFQNGASRFLKSGDTMKFSVSSENHNVKVDSFDNANKKATITVTSTPQTATLAKGESKKFDVNSDNQYDVEVTLVDVLIGTARIKIQAASGEVPVAPSTSTSSEEEEDQTAGTQEQAETSSSNLWVILGIVLLAIILALVIFFVYKKRK